MTPLKHVMRGIALLSLLALAACDSYTLVPAAPATDANFKVDVNDSWNKANKLLIESSAPVAYWTSDGPALDSILFVGGVKTGKPILTVGREDEVKDKLLRSEEHTSELQSLMRISYAVFCLKKKNKQKKPHRHTTEQSR